MEGPVPLDLAPQVAFDEGFYLRTYPDIAQAVETGAERSGFEHYVNHGRKEGRLGFPFDESWYLATYPLVEPELSAGMAATAAEHFEKVGRHRGYLPAPTAARPDDPAQIPSRFGGLWIDQPNARDIVAGRRDIGLITRRQADLLLSFIDNGFVVLESAVPDREVERALADLEAAYSGAFEALLFECRAVSRENTPWQREFNLRPAKALDLHMFSEAIRDLIFSERVMEFVQLVFDAKAFASQSLGFYRGSAQDAHQDSAYVPYTRQRHFVASWIALEDVQAGAGELFYLKGSHRLADYLFASRFKSVAEAARCEVAKEQLDREIPEHVRGLPERSAANGMTEETFLAKRGDVLIWHADLAHGGKPISVSRSRRSVVTHYCPKYSVPLFAEQRRVAMHDHHGKGFYTTSYY